jgi:hypothetical protein
MGVDRSDGGTKVVAQTKVNSPTFYEKIAFTS